MGTPEVIGIITVVILAISVGVALFIGLKSIRHTGKIQEQHFTRTEIIQERENRQRLLKEIIAWAVDILKCSPTLDINIRIDLESMHDQRKMQDLLADDVRWKFNAIKGEGIYIKRIALHFDEDLQDAVNLVSNKLVSQTKLLEQVPEGKCTLSDAASSRERLNESAIDLIDKAVNLLVKKDPIN